MNLYNGCIVRGVKKCNKSEIKEVRSVNQRVGLVWIVQVVPTSVIL